MKLTLQIDPKNLEYVVLSAVPGLRLKARDDSTYDLDTPVLHPLARCEILARSATTIEIELTPAISHPRYAETLDRAVHAIQAAAEKWRT